MNFEKLEMRYTSFELDLFRESNSLDNRIILQKHLVTAAGWGLIYYRNTIPEYGYYRAGKMLRDFNRYFGWNLSTTVYKPVLERDYSFSNEEVVRLLTKKKREKNDARSKSKIKKFSLFRKIIKKRP